MSPIRVFLVEDEAIIREGLRDGIPWQQYGYTFVGEASDGEQALPLIRRERPDVLITDIRMPFMDGLELSRLVARELPAVKIIILSGYDDFDYARQAIQIGVEQYLLKPITRSMLENVLKEIAGKIESEQEQVKYQDKFRGEIQEYEQFSRKNLLEQIIGGELSAAEIFDRAGELGMALDAESYNLVLFTIQDKEETKQVASEPVIQLREELMSFCLDKEQYMMVRQTLTNYAVLIRCGRDEAEEKARICVDGISGTAAGYENQVDWYLAAGHPVDRISRLPECFARARRCLSHRYIMPHCHILTEEPPGGDGETDVASLNELDLSRVDPAILSGFLKNGQPSELEEFIRDYMEGVAKAARSRLFAQYLVLHIRFTVLAFVESIGADQEEFLSDIDAAMGPSQVLTAQEMVSYLRSMLKKALAFRDDRSRSQTGDMMRRAVAYIDENYASDAISLGDTAGYVGVSANYFSAVFSQEMKKTFVEYVTEKRMEEARRLLRTTELKTAQVAAQVGYKDPHYFSFVFRKTQNLSPREFRRGWERGEKEREELRKEV